MSEEDTNLNEGQGPENEAMSSVPGSTDDPAVSEPPPKSDGSEPKRGDKKEGSPGGSSKKASGGHRYFTVHFSLSKTALAQIKAKLSLKIKSDDAVIHVVRDNLSGMTPDDMVDYLNREIDRRREAELKSKETDSPPPQSPPEGGRT